MSKKRYAIVGTGSRAGMYVQALTTTYADSAELVALCDSSRTRAAWYKRQVAERTGVDVPTYPASDFDTMLAQARVDTVIVATVDATHDDYIVRAMERGCDVITEKPMTTDANKIRRIYDAIAQTGRSLRVTFNYRYSPTYTAFRKVIAEGAIGRPLAVDFSWMLDTSHGADYFRRWHREKRNSGGLLVHKATHHFDLVNWWIGARPQAVMAMGGLQFYGRKNAEARGERYSYERYTGVPEAAGDPFALDLTQSEQLRGLYHAAEAETGYLRDRNVFGGPIDIEDTMSVSVRYHGGAILSYCLVAYSPWEGLRVAVTGTKGRVEMHVVEDVIHLLGDGRAKESNASKGSFREQSIRVYPMFGQPYEIEVPAAAGGHGGADPVMLEQLFSPTPPPDPFERAASHVDGAASVLVGIAANESMRTGRLVTIDEMFELSPLTPQHTLAQGVKGRA